MIGTIKLNEFLIHRVKQAINGYTEELEEKRFFVLIDLIIEHSRYYKGQFARLKAEYLKKKLYLGKHYKKYIKILKDHNIIDVTRGYKVGKRSRQYSLHPDILKDTTKEDLCMFGDVEVTPEYYKEKKKHRKRPTKRKLRLQYETLKSKDFQIDVEAARKWVEQYFIDNPDIENAENKIIFYNRMIDDLNSKRIFASEDEKTGRVFTNFTCIKKELRQFCSFKGISYVSKDLKSAQPYLLASELMLKPEYGTKPDIINFYEIITGKTTDIYEHMIERSGLFHLLRDDAKVEFLIVLYSDNRGKTKFKPVFKLEFPNVYEYISKVKREKSNKLALHLQELESNIFIPICTKFAKMGCLSVHDSLYFPENIMEQVVEQLKKRFNKLGYKGFILD